MNGNWQKIETLLRSAIAEVPEALYTQNFDDGEPVGEAVEEALGYLEHNELGLAYEALEDIGVEFDISEAFRDFMARAAEMMG